MHPWLSLSAQRCRIGCLTNLVVTLPPTSSPGRKKGTQAHLHGSSVWFSRSSLFFSSRTPRPRGKRFATLQMQDTPTTPLELPLLAAEDGFDWARALRTTTPPGPPHSFGRPSGRLPELDWGARLRGGTVGVSPWIVDLSAAKGGTWQLAPGCQINI
jgi:hypothetical protein